MVIFFALGAAPTATLDSFAVTPPTATTDYKCLTGFQSGFLTVAFVDCWSSAGGTTEFGGRPMGTTYIR